MGERSGRFWYERISSVVSLAITLVSLVISLVALSIAQKTYVYSSKDYTPAIDYFIDERENLTITNQSSDLFKIQMIKYITFKQIGYEDYRRNVVVQIPFITRSILYPWVDMDNNPEKITIESKLAAACAYICPYDSNLINKITDKIYAVDSASGYALPSLQSRAYVVEILYVNKFQEKKSLIFLQEHLHGYGYDKSTITDSHLDSMLRHADIPKVANENNLWKYLNDRFAVQTDQFY